MDMLRSSILGREFINYRRVTDQGERVRFSQSVRSPGVGNVPVVIDSVDNEIGAALSRKVSDRYRTYGKEIVCHVDWTLSDLMKEVKIALLQNDCEYIFKEHKLHLGLEDGTIPDAETTVGALYKKYRNAGDKILYVLVTKEQTMYGYVVSIVRYLAMAVKKYLL